MGIKVKQHDISDCGVACLASVAGHHKLNVPLARIRQFAGTDRRGTNVLGLLQAAHQLGFEAKGVRGDADSLNKIPRPAILHVVIKDRHHFVVLYKCGGKHVLVMDPADGRMHRLGRDKLQTIWTGVMVLLVPGEVFIKGNRKIAAFNRFWSLLRPHRYILLQALAGALVYTLLGFSTSIYIQKLTDFVFIGGNTNLLNLLSVTMIVLLILQIIIASFKDVYLTRTGQLIDLRLILGYYRHLLKLPQRFFDGMQVGELLSRINDAIKIRAFINNVSLNLTVNLMIVVFSFSLMLAIYWPLALIMLIMVPAFTGLYLLVNFWNRKTERDVMEASAGVESQLVESLSGIKTLKYFGLEEYAGIQTETRFTGLLYKTYKSTLNHVFSGNTSYFISGLFTIILLWSGSYFVVSRAITPGQLMSFYAILGYFTAPVSGLISANRDMQNALIAADRLFEIMDLEREEDAPKPQLGYVLAGDIRFEGVSFSYGSGAYVLKDLDLIIPQGKITAILGESGSGKSTLANLLQKMYPIQKGQIRIGMTNLNSMPPGELRNQIGIVPQEIHLFSGSILENIAYGDPAPDAEAVAKLCSLLGMESFMDGLPNGLFTKLGENGTNLSGGQRQRLAIARALYRNPPVLILDEATSSLDSATEYQIQRALKRLRKSGKTIVQIAHRLGTVVYADKIVVLRNGKVLEEGNHEELFKAKSYYYNMWQRQMPGYSHSA